MFQFFKKLFQPSPAQEPEVPQSQPLPPQEEQEEKFLFFLPALNAEVELINWTEQPISDVTSLNQTLNTYLDRHLTALCQLSLKEALLFIEVTGEATYALIDSDDDAEELVADFQTPDAQEWVDYLSRWFSPQDSQRLIDHAKSLAFESPELTQDFDGLCVLVGQAVLALNVTKDNFGNAYPALKEALAADPRLILDFVELRGLILSKMNDQPVFILDFNCDWEIEHGLNWTVGADHISVNEAW